MFKCARKNVRDEEVWTRLTQRVLTTSPFLTATPDVPSPHPRQTPEAPRKSWKDQEVSKISDTVQVLGLGTQLFVTVVVKLVTDVCALSTLRMGLVGGGEAGGVSKQLLATDHSFERCGLDNHLKCPQCSPQSVAVLEVNSAWCSLPMSQRSEGGELVSGISRVQAGDVTLMFFAYAKIKYRDLKVACADLFKQTEQ
eukprot:6472788-Amphidinium_carterae.1